MTQIIVIFILNYSHILSINSSLNLNHKFSASFLWDHRTLNFSVLLINWMEKPLLVEISIIIISDKFFINFTALTRYIDVFLGVGDRFQTIMLAIVTNTKVLLRCSDVSLHEEVTGPRLFLTLGDSDHLTVHSAHYFYRSLHNILLLLQMVT